MKCDELQYERLGEANWAYPASTLVIRKQFVDEAVAELKDIAENACLECDDNQTAIDELEDENRKLKRALWMARAERALEKIAWFKLWNASISTMNPEDGARQEFDKWKKNLGKFLKRAEEYK